MSTAPAQTFVVCVVSAVESEARAASQARQALSRVVESAIRPVEAFSEFDLFEGGAREFLVPRWGTYPRAARYDSEAGQAMVEEALAEMDRKFAENLDSIRAILDSYADDRIQANEELIRDQFLSVGAYVGQSVHVYGDGGQPLRSREKFREYVGQRDDLWVVPAVARQ